MMKKELRDLGSYGVKVVQDSAIKYLEMSDRDLTVSEIHSYLFEEAVMTISTFINKYLRPLAERKRPKIELISYEYYNGFGYTHGYIVRLIKRKAK